MNHRVAIAVATGLFAGVLISVAVYMKPKPKRQFLVSYIKQDATAVGVQFQYGHRVVSSPKFGTDEIDWFKAQTGATNDTVVILNVYELNRP